jgi:outer membrane protein assembly factor BamB
MRLRSPLTCALTLLAVASLALAGCTDSPAPTDGGDSDAPAAPDAEGDGSAQLGPAASGEPTGSLPWALTPALVEGNTLVAVNNLMDVANEGMWTMGAGVTAFDLGSGEQIWHLDYDAEVFGIDTAALPTEATAEAFSNKEGKVAVVYSAMTCPEDECTGEEPEDFALVVLDTSSGKVLSSVTGVGAFPTVVAFSGDVVVYAPDWEHVIAVNASNAGGDPVWQSPTFDIYPDAIIDNAVFTAIPEDVPDALGWVNIADGESAQFALDLDAYQTFSLPSASEAFVTWGDGEDHVIEKVDPVTSEIVWQAVVPAGDEENETIEVTSTRVLLSYDAEETYRTVALDRETGEQVWTREDASAGLVADGWALLDSSGTATSWPVVNVEDGTEVTVIDASADILPSVELTADFALIAHAGMLEALPLTGDSAGSDTPAWSVETASTDAEITSQLGELILIDPQTGATQRVELPS